MSQTFQVSNGDIIVSSANGRPILILDALKVRQDIQEFFTVNVQPNGFGAGIEELIGVVELNKDVFVSMAARQVDDGMDVFISLQNSQLSIPRSPYELISGVTNIQVAVDPNNPTTFYFNANIVTQAGAQIPMAQVTIGG